MYKAAAIRLDLPEVSDRRVITIVTRNLTRCVLFF